MKHKNPTTDLTTLDSTPATNIRDTREEKFIDCLFLAKSVREAGLMAGYSKEYCQRSIYNKFKSQAFQTKFIERFKSDVYTDLPLIRAISKQGLKRIHEDLVSGNGDLASKLRHIPTQALQITKLLSPEVVGNVINLVNIESMQTLIAGKLPPTGSDTE